VLTAYGIAKLKQAEPISAEVEASLTHLCNRIFYSIEDFLVNLKQQMPEEQFRDRKDAIVEWAEALHRFRLLKISRDAMQRQGIPESVLEALESLFEMEVLNRREFVDRLRALLTDQQCQQYQATLMTFAEIPLLQPGPVVITVKDAAGAALLAFSPKSFCQRATLISGKGAPPNRPVTVRLLLS
jgi:hypothetical protein